MTDFSVPSGSDSDYVDGEAAEILRRARAQENSPFSRPVSPEPEDTNLDKGRIYGTDSSGDTYGYATAEETEDFRRWLEQFRLPPEAKAAQEAARQAAEAERKALAAERLREADELRRLQRAGLAPLPDRTWQGHLMWLYQQFADREFTTRAVRDTAVNDGWTAPPGRLDPASPDFTRRLGLAYAEMDGRLVDRMWLSPGGLTCGARRWQLSVKDE